MQVSISSTLTILHDGQFWVGICERRDGALYGACRFVFGPEPADEDVLAFVRDQWGRLDFRMALEAARRGVGTKAQQAIAAAYEERKDERRACARERREAEARRAFELRTAKRKRKHRGH